jgi:hypothetical protein
MRFLSPTPLGRIPNRPITFAYEGKAVVMQGYSLQPESLPAQPLGGTPDTKYIPLKVCLGQKKMDDRPDLTGIPIGFGRTVNAGILIPAEAVGTCLAINK